MTRLWFVILVGLLAAGVNGTPNDGGPGSEEHAKLNIVLIVADDLGWTDLGCTGSDYYQTENLDRLRSEGMLFTNAYSGCANCAPSRAALMTGRYGPRTGMYTVGSPNRGKKAQRALLCPENKRELDPEFFTIAEELRGLGYATGHFGKWHLGAGATGPEGQGFEVNVAGGRAGHPASYFSPYRNPAIEDGPEGEHLTERLGNEAAEFVRTHADGPFFLYLPFYAVHTPIQPPVDLLEQYTRVPPGKHHSNTKYAALVSAMDRATGQVLRAIDEVGLRDRTVVLFTSDNGGMGLVTSNAPLRGSKGMFYEGGIRVPLIVRWPGMVGAGTSCDTPVTGVDFMPTLGEMAGASRSGLAESDGVSFIDLLHGKERENARSLFWHFPAYLESGGVVDGPWRTTPCSVIRRGTKKLIRFYEGNRIELYDLSKDPGETRNIASDEPETKAELLSELAAWLEETGARVPDKPNPDFAGPWPGPTPEGMVWIPGGEFLMGSTDPEARADERPVRRVTVDGFWMDRTETTNEAFAAFVEATGYVTTAERAPRLEDIMAQLPPGTPEPDPEVLKPGSLLFDMPRDGHPGGWRWAIGVNWRNPLGDGSAPKPDHPVVHVSYDDAVAYATWAGKRLPTEAEFERAARGGIKHAVYVWGDTFEPEDVPRANYWQGRFPMSNDGVDGFVRTAPVGSFAPNGYGLYDMAGNVWEWTSDWYHARAYAMTERRVRNPTGPTESFDPDEPTVPKHTVRGGSYLCSADSCTGYRPSARMKTSPDTSLCHTGFRCVMTVEMWRERQDRTIAGENRE